MTTKVICKTCGRTFELTEKQIDFYNMRGWSTPKHCITCRDEAREDRQSPYYGWQEVMANYMPCKQRRQRVHYKPHLVGGFR